MIATFKKLHDDAIMPVRATEFAVGYDLCAYLGDEVEIFTPRNNRIFRGVIERNGKRVIVLEPGERALIKTGITVALDKSVWAGLYIRSGIALKYGLSLANGVGVIDSDYEGEICAIIRNESAAMSDVIAHKERIAQLVIHPVMLEAFQSAKEPAKKRGRGGFGSTGVEQLATVEA